MLLRLIDQKIRRAFSNAAAHYDMLTALHKDIGRELIKKIQTEAPTPSLLEIGMGTGWFTGKLCHFFSDSLIVGLDFADGMVAAAGERAENFKIIQADAAAMPFRSAVFDVVVSNLTFQWLSNLAGSFSLCHRVIKQEGVFCFTMFGRDTLAELFEAFEQSAAAEERGRVREIRCLASAEEVRLALESSGFRVVELTTERIKAHFPDMLALIKWTKDIGANQLEKNVFIGKEWLGRAGGYYDRHYRDGFGVVATFEVIWAFGKKIE